MRAFNFHVNEPNRKIDIAVKVTADRPAKTNETIFFFLH